MSRRRDEPTLETFKAISVEGTLLTPEMLTQIAHLTAGEQDEASYGVPKGLGLRDEIGRYWRIALAHWQDFEKARRGANPQAGTERFIEVLLRNAFGFGTLQRGSTQVIGQSSYPITFSALGGRVPLAVASCSVGLDEPDARFGEEGRRRSAFTLMQDYLNAAEGALWGSATDGLRLRLLRRNTSLTRPSWIEADLEAMFVGEGRFADFSVLWLLLHESRFGWAETPPSDCALERWREKGREEGTRARDKLRDGVEAALLSLGQGFLSHAANTELRQALDEGALAVPVYFQQLLRLVYRLIFLLTAEERELLHPQSADTEAVDRYRAAYSLQRLARRSARRSAHDRHDDLWQGLKVVFRGLAKGEPLLALPALGGLFAADQCAVLDTGRLENRHLLFAIYRLAWLKGDHGLIRINLKDMGPEELGSVYEGLLELIPVVGERGRTFSFASRSAAQGHERKTSGSYYTHDDLVQFLLDRALEPLISERVATHPERAAEALLEMSVIDPACGSGHFLLGAARRLAMRIARIRANGTPPTAEYRAALREVISRCIYGVDRNPMAVELCKAALWIETVVPGRPLSFLDAHIRCGDALLGLFDMELLDVGIPSEAFEARDGDDKEAAKALKQANRQRVRSAASLPLMAAATQTMRTVDELPEDTVEQIEAKRQALAAAESTEEFAKACVRADLFCAAFFARKTAATKLGVPITADIDRVAAGQPSRAEAVATARALSAQHRFFHWTLAFPQVFEKGGFDLVLGNPPWKTMSPDAKQWFGRYDPAVRDMAPEDQERRIAELLAMPGMQAAWDQNCRALYDAAAFIKESGRFKLFAKGNLGKGDFNVYRMFVETALTAVRAEGTAAQFVPENLYNGANAAAIRAKLFNDFDLHLLAGFENTRKVWFADIDTRAKFCLYVAAKGRPTNSFPAAFGVNTREKLAGFRAGQLLNYPVAQVHEFSPDALAIAEIAHPSDVAIVQKLYARFPKFGEDRQGLARRQYLREIDMGTDRDDFGNDPNGVPLYEGRMVEAFDHRAKAYVSGRARKAVWRELKFGTPQKAIVPQWRIAIRNIPDKTRERWQQYRIGYCDVGGATNQRFLMATVIPPVGPCGHSVPTILFEPADSRLSLYWLGVANAICMDYLARKKASNHLTFTVMDSLPLPRAYSGTLLEREIATRALRLTATGPEMQLFWDTVASSVGLDPQRDVPCEELQERERLIAELDVLVARDIFGLTRDEVRYLLEPADILGPNCSFETFGALQRAEKRAYGEFRTRRLIFEAWDRLDHHTERAELQSVPTETVAAR